MVNKIKKYITIWWILTSRTTQIAFISRFGASLFLAGKIIRFVFFLLFLIAITSRTKLIGGYTVWQMAFFYLTFNFIDTLAQFFLREVYRFRRHIVSGFFDHYLSKPVPVLFRSLFGGSDALDIPMLILSAISLCIVAFHLPNISVFNILLFVLLLANGFIIALSFHIFVLCLGIITTEVDNAIMFYRDLTQMGRVPVDIYQSPLRELITFVIPVGIMITIPAKALMGILDIRIVFLSLIISLLLFWLSLSLWKYSLRAYTSASS